MPDLEGRIAIVTGAGIVVLDFGRKTAEGPPARAQQEPAVIAASLGAK